MPRRVEATRENPMQIRRLKRPIICEYLYEGRKATVTSKRSTLLKFDVLKASAGCVRHQVAVLQLDRRSSHVSQPYS